MAIFIILILLFFAILSLFAFPQLSPIPYFPSNPKDMHLILKALKLTNGQTVVDLGAGDGIVVFEAAKTTLEKKLDTRFVAVEINPVLVLLLHVRRFFNPNRDRITIVWGDLFKLDYRHLVKKNTQCTLYLYVTPRLIPSIVDTFKKSIPRFTTVSYLYKVDKTDKPRYTGVHPIFIHLIG